MDKYDHNIIDKKWQKEWFSNDMYKAKNDDLRPKFYGLIEFPFPSGEGLHIGHIKSNTAMDIICRKKRMEGFNVLYPIGWDAFGLPTENYAIKTGIHPKVVTKRNTDRFREQLKSCGFSFDWSREVNTSDPEYYKWTQWIFLKLFENGLAYKNKQSINWCPSCKIGLANEEAVGGVCDRCGGPTELKDKDQWMLAITKYADRLDKDLDTVDYLEKIKIQQRNWIGRSEGVELEFLIKNTKESIKVFTTRPDTIFGVTYVVIAPENNLIQRLKSQISNFSDVQEYIEKIRQQDEIERISDKKDKTGIELKNIKAINPATNAEIPVFVADYVLASYGTGSVMAVPAHDERDYKFAKKYNLPIKAVIIGGDISKQAYIGLGNMINSGKFNDRDSVSIKKEIVDFIGGKYVTQYKLRDWVFSRQRYWGEPIPMIFCENCKIDNPKSQGWVPVPVSELPVKLPDIEKYEPTDNGESPLATVHDWVNTTCPRCGKPAKRETDTMPNWAGSSWYYLRYIDPSNSKVLADIDKLKYWMNVDWYNGGMEHTTLHLLYSRFWHKFLYDIKVVSTIEPYNKRTSHGFILGEGGVKMSKSKGNVINPDEIVSLYGADTLRVYEMFMGPFDQSAIWSTESIIGSRRFIDKVWRLHKKVTNNIVSQDKIDVVLNQTIKKISDDIESMSFNTSISSLMILVNELEKSDNVLRGSYEVLLKLLAPFAPHITEELWHKLDNKGSIHLTHWPQFDKNKLIKSKILVAVQINGKTKSIIEVVENSDQSTVEAEAVKLKVFKNTFNGVIPRKIIYVKNKIINFIS